MGRLHQVILRNSFALLTFFSAPLVSGQGYCSLTVRVTAPDGRRPAVSVRVVEKSGRVEELDQEKSDVKFCDLGGLPVTVSVGEEGTCNQVVVREVPVSWNEPYALHILYDPTPCFRDLPRPPVPTCRVVFRVADETGQWIQNAIVSITPPIQKELRTDQFGRSSVLAKLGDDVVGSVTAQRGSANFKYRCALGQSVYEEYLTVK